MNWLAHICLSADDIDVRLGNLLADRLKGRAFAQANSRFQLGLALHRHIDAVTDKHPLVRSRKRLLKPGGYLGAVVLDVAFDHLLARHWPSYFEPSLADFLQRFEQQALLAINHYPADSRGFVQQLLASGHLLQYQSFSAVERALWRIDQRLSPRVLARDSASSYLPMLERQLPQIEQEFLVFFPQLQSEVELFLQRHA